MTFADWDLARRRAAALVPAGPRPDRAEARAAVAGLRAAAVAAPEHVAAVTGLDEAAAAAARGPVLVVDRAGWASANVDIFAGLLDGALTRPRNRLSRWGAAQEIAVLLPLLSTRVLGQFDPFTARLLLVAPNVAAVGTALHLDAADFRLWVTLHEQTHAVQAAAAPWLADHLRGALGALVASLDAEEDAVDRLGQAVRALPRLLDDGEPGTGGVLLDAMLSPSEQESMERVVATMSLLEGHADVVMDAVGTRVVPTVHTIRRAFERRRDGTPGAPGLVDRLLRRLIGMDAKLAQYRNGAAFVRGVVARVGHEGLNAVFTAPERLPIAAEIADPAAWVRRVHG